MLLRLLDQVPSLLPPSDRARPPSPWRCAVVVSAKVSKRAKTILPKECSFFLEPSLIALVKDMTGHDFPVGVKTKGPRCEYLSLVARMPSDKTVWILPEIWAAVKNDTDLKQKLKA
jgi:hypothetical protein